MSTRKRTNYVHEGKYVAEVNVELLEDETGWSPPVAGISNSFTPSGAKASMMAFMTAGKAPTVPASPAPFTPRGFNFVGAGLLPTSIAHTSSARGMQ
jgi:hypothetical protein